MKRALAERAKQSQGLKSNGTKIKLETPRSSPPESQMRASKIPRRSQDVSASETHVPGVVPSSSQVPEGTKEGQNGKQQSKNSSSAGSAPSTTTPTRGRYSSSGSSSLKRQRGVSSALNQQCPSGDEDEDNQSAFYLKHQNSALASEMRAMRYQLTQLEHERDYRRRHCRIACQALNSLQATWTQMETSLDVPSHSALNTTEVETYNKRIPSSYVASDAPRSTGNGKRVELLGALFDALASLATTSPDLAHSSGEESDDGGRMVSNRGASEDIDPMEKQHLDDLSNISLNVLQRANALEKWIWSLLQQIDSPDGERKINPQFRDQTKELIVLRGKCREYQVQIEELSKARDDVAASERKVRRSIYRLSAGRVKIKQVVKDLEKSDEDGTLASEATMEALAAKNSVLTSISSTQASDLVTKGSGKDNEIVETAELNSLQKQLTDLQQQLVTRDKRIQQINDKLRESEERVNKLTTREFSEEDEQKVQKFEITVKKLETAEAELKDLKEKLNATRAKWSSALGDSEHVMKTLDELDKKNKKRWNELTTLQNCETEKGDVDSMVTDTEICQSKKITELEHKVKQALENVRQADVVRQNLKEALTMNESLQAKLEEVKSKYAALQAGRSSSSTSKSGSDPATSTSASTSSNSREKSSYSSSDKAELSRMEKMQRDHRKMRKEVAALTASKDAAKAKLERIEKEHSVFVEANARILKQSAEKDEMNAKSLSTILHLKNLTEELKKEKESLEHQVKSSSQLALAARLATNAKDRVAEEVAKENEALQKKVEDNDGIVAILKSDLKESRSSYAEADARITILKAKLDKAMARSDELVTEAEKGREENTKLQDSLDKALRHGSEVSDRLRDLEKRTGSGGGGSSSFTVEQLNTQVKVLKGRLACPVCHYRDKNCIIMRCRHMFCKQCVEENIQNRSRKCPSCGLKFSEKDVEDVWL